MFRRKVLSAVLLAGVVMPATLAGIPGAARAELFEDVPEAPDPSRRHLVYLHGAWVEQRGTEAPHPRHGAYELPRIVAALSEAGFVVVSEQRRTRVRSPDYASKVADRVRRLLAKGVPPENVLVAGHSKGGHIALIAATLLAEPKLSYAILAGCGRSGTGFGNAFQRFVEAHGSDLRGRFLSLYDESDRVAGTCRALFDRASGVASQEVVLHTGRGHGLFYSPRPEWIRPLVAWGEGR